VYVEKHVIVACMTQVRCTARFFPCRRTQIVLADGAAALLTLYTVRLCR